MIIPSVLLSILGIVVIYSSSPALAIQQILFLLFGLVLFFFLSFFDFRALKGVIKSLYLVILVLLVIVFLIGFETRGSLRWIPLGLFNFQPSEFAKPILILLLADFWSKKDTSWQNIALSLGLILPIVFLIFKQPDLGTTLTIGFIYIVMLLSANISLLKFVIITSFSFGLTPLGWLFLRGYQKERFLSFLSPNSDPQGIGYNVIQSTIAVGSGELTGRGLGRGTQSRLQFLPEFRTDFIFASIAEELGLVGSLIVLSLYGLIFFFLFKIISQADDRFGELIVVGVASMIFVQMVINIGMNTGLLPITGITLPLLSYGGSSVLTIYICLGLAQSVQRFGLRRREVDTFSL